MALEKEKQEQLEKSREQEIPKDEKFAIEEIEIEEIAIDGICGVY